MTATIPQLEAAFDRELATDTRAAAETAYALAFRYRNEDIAGKRRFDVARAWATRALDLLDELPSECLEHAVSTRAEVGGVPIPGLLHSGVARTRLADVLVS